MSRHHLSPLSRITIQRSPKSPRLGFSTQLWGLVPDASLGIPGDGWNGSPVLSMMQQRKNIFYPPIAGQADAVYDRYDLLLLNSPNRLPTRSLSGEASVANAHPSQQPTMALSLPDVFPGPSGPWIQAEEQDNQFVVQADPMADWAERDQRFNSDTPQAAWHSRGGSPPLADDQMPNESWAITDVVANSTDHGRYKTETQIPITPFGEKPLKSSSRGLRMIPQEENRVPLTENEGKHQGQKHGGRKNVQGAVSM
ncbi:hypothetical protein H4582DRAFT_2058983 [Lactarius indigo]|nr:hypothetical protein H4582DRAFT_2058983 [Lactarius indigo]